jgi:hypothetical protein
MGTAIAALLNGRARKVTPSVVRALGKALPRSTILVSDDFDQARRHVRTLIQEHPDVILSGGGDGAAMSLLNFWREEGGAALPTLGILRLGTGNGWARSLGAPEFFPHLKRLALLRHHPLPVQEFGLVEVENKLAHFAGVGWDARIINDYQRNLDKRSSQLVGSRLASWLHKGVRGYLYSVARITIPEEWKLVRRLGQARVTLENLGPEVFGLDEADEFVQLPPEARLSLRGQEARLHQPAHLRRRRARRGPQRRQPLARHAHERNARLVRHRRAHALLAADAVPDRRRRHGRARGDRPPRRLRDSAGCRLAHRPFGMTEPRLLKPVA